MKNSIVFYICSVLCALCSAAQSADFPLSSFGQIQNVQNYSTMPGWNPNSPYNKKMPVPVYAQGTDVKTGECQTIVAGLVYAQCSMANNCSGKRISDIKPAVMNQLAQMSGGNYVSSCAGYIDGAFADYQKNYGSALIGGGFPAATAPVPARNDFVIENPYKVEPVSWKVPIIERAVELNSLQKQNAQPTKLVAASMPKTFQDLSFVERNAALKEGYDPWQCDPKTGKNCAYQQNDIESNLTYLTRKTDEETQKAELEKQKNLVLKTADRCAWCKKNSVECYTEYAGQLEKLNKAVKEKACAAKKPGIDVTYSAWDVISDNICGWILKENAVKMILDDAACNKTSPQSNSGDAGGTNSRATGDGITTFIIK